jgi:hypothetical protein
MGMNRRAGCGQPRPPVAERGYRDAMPAGWRTTTPFFRRLVAAGLALCAAVLGTGCQRAQPGGPMGLAALPSTATAPLPIGPGAPADPRPVSHAAAAGRHGGRRDTELAAVAAVVRRYYGLFNAATSARTASRIAALVVRRCSCFQLVRSFRAAARNHERYVGRGHLTAVRPEYDSPSAAGALVSFDATAAGLVRADGSFVDHVSARHDVTEHLDLVPVRGGWRIVDVTLVSAGVPG